MSAGRDLPRHRDAEAAPGTGSGETVQQVSEATRRRTRPAYELCGCQSLAQRERGRNREGRVWGESGCSTGWGEWACSIVGAIHLPHPPYLPHSAYPPHSPYPTYLTHSPRRCKAP
jgi:hypothetical protein